MSRSLLARGGGDRGHFLTIDCVPGATLKSELDAFIAAGTVVIGKFVYLSFGANYEVESPAVGGRVDGKIIAIRADDVNSTYRLTCRIWTFADDNGNVYPAHCIVQGPYSGTLALQNSCECASTTTYFEWADGTTDGFHNAVIALDVPASGYCDVII